MKRVENRLVESHMREQQELELLLAMGIAVVDDHQRNFQIAAAVAWLASHQHR